MANKNTLYTLEELKYKYDNEYVEIVSFNNANDILVRCRICGDLYKTKTGNLKRHQIHNKCYGIVNGKRHEKFTLKEVKELYDDEHKEIVEYTNAKNILCKCKHCGNMYNTTIESLKKHCIHRKCQGLHDSRRTPEKCAEKLKRLQDIKHPYVDVLEYRAYNDVVCRCKLCNKIIKTSSRTIYNKQIHRDCAMYNTSNGEKEICNILDILNIQYFQEYSFDDCKNILPLRFDFYIPSFNMCIEYQGQQHYRPAQFPKDTKEDAVKNYYKIIENDEIKYQYCKDNNIKLLIISYKDFENLYDILESELSQIN